MSDRLFRIGLCGQIASGKSSLAAALVASVELRVAIGGTVEHVDADALLRSARATDDVLQAEILREVPNARRADGSIDRAILAAQAFSNPVLLRRLEEIQWPVVRKALQDLSRDVQARGARLLLVEAIALGRSGLAQELDATLYLQVDEAVRRDRFLLRGGSEAEFRARNAAQTGIPAEMESIKALHVDGNGPLTATVDAASKVLRRLCLQGESID